MNKGLLSLFLLIAGSVWSQSPDLINYQGMLRNNAGIPIVNRQVRLQFELRQGSITGAAAFTETASVSTNMLGLFNARIGEQNGAGLASIDWLNGPWFLAVAVDTSNGDNFTELGTQQLVSVPFAMHARTAGQVSSSFTNNVLTIAGNSYTLDPPLVYSAGNGISVNGTTISNSAPDQTISLQPAGNNISVNGVYPNFTVSSSPQLAVDGAGNLSISDGNTVNITPQLSLSGNVITSGPTNNSVSLPQQSSVHGTGAASVNPAGAPSYTVHVPPTQIAVTTTVGAATASSIGINNYNINLPPPQYNAVTGDLLTGSNITNITPSVNFNSANGQLIVGPPGNSVTVPPTSIVVSQTAGAAAVSSTAANVFTINIPAPLYNSGSGVFGTGTATAQISPSLAVNAGVLRVGAVTNTVTLPPAPTVTASGLAVSTSAGNTVTINVPPLSYNASTGVLSSGTNTTAVNPAVAVNSGVLRVGATTNTVTLPAAPTVTATGMANSSTAGNTITIDVPQLTYNAGTGVLSSGANTTAVNPTVALNAGTLRVGATSNTVNLSVISPWTVSGNSVSLVDTSRFVGIGTSFPAEMLQLGSFDLAQDNYLAIRTAGGNFQKAGIKLNHFSLTDGFTIESNEIVNRLDFIRHAITSETVMSMDRMTGRVGIGTTAPDATLSVEGSVDFGSGNTVTTGTSIAAGSNNSVSGIVSGAIGTSNNVSANRAFAFGNFGSAGELGSMVLGDWGNGAPTVVSASLPNQLSARFENGYRFFTDNSLTANDALFISPAGKMGLGNPTPPWKFTVNGPASSPLNGPHATFITSTDQYPTMQLLNWNHDDTWLTFDAYHDGSFRSSSNNNNYAVAKTGGMLRLMYSSAAPGSFIGFSSGLSMDNTGQIGIGPVTPTTPLHVLRSGSGHVVSSENTQVINADNRAFFGRSVNNPGYGIGGYFDGGFMGVWAVASGGSYTGGAYGVYGSSSGTAGTRYGVFGTASGGTTNYGVYCVGAGGYTGSWTNLSDIRFKENIQPLTGGLQKVMQLSPKTYTMKREQYSHMNLSEGTQIGLIAQEVEKVLPELVEQGTHPGPIDPVTGRPGEDIRFKSMNYIGLTPVLIQAIKEQQQQIEELKATVAEQQKAIDELKNK